MRRALFTGLLLASAYACGDSHKDPIPPAEAGAGGDAGQPSGDGGDSGGSGGSGGSSSSGAGGEGGETSEGGEGGTAGALGGAAGEGGDSTGGSSANGGMGGAAGQGGRGGVAGSMAGTTSAGAGGVNAGSGGAGGAAAGTGGRGGVGGVGGSDAGKGGLGAGGASGTVLFFEDFESGTTRWTATPSGVWATTTDGSTVYAATGAVGSAVARVASAGELTWTDVAIDARVKVTNFAGTSSGYFAGVCARYQSSSNYACFTLRSNGQVGFRVSGTNTAASNPPGGSITEGVWYSIRVVAIGSNITAFVNGTEIDAASRVTSGAPLNGSIALFAPATNAVFDDVRVTVP